MAVVIRVMLFMLLALIMQVSADAVLVGKDLISNSSFENRPGGKDEDPRGWGTWNSDYNGLATDQFRSGSQSAYFICPKTGDSEGTFFTYAKVKPGKEYTFSAYAKNSSKEPMKGEVFGQISIEWFKKGKDKDGKDILIELKRDWGPEFGPELPIIKWAPFTMTATAPVDSDTCRFVIQFFNKGGGSGKFFVDDVSAEELEQYFKEKGKDITAENLLPNGSFEEPKGIAGSDPSEWISWDSDYNGIGTKKAKTGNQSVYISSPPQPESHSGIYYQYNGVKPGKAYVFFCYVLNTIKDPLTKGAFGQLSIEWRKGDKELSRNWGPTFGAGLSTTGWKLESMTAVAPADADNCKFVIQILTKDGKGTFYVDDVTVEEK